MYNKWDNEFTRHKSSCGICRKKFGYNKKYKPQYHSKAQSKQSSETASNLRRMEMKNKIAWLNKTKQ